MNLMLIDAHTHIDHYDEQQLVTALAEIREYKILTLSNGMHPDSYQHTLNLVAEQPFIISCLGVHPWVAAEWVNRLEEMEPLLAQSPLFGELGLDYRWVDKATIPAQQRVLDFFLQAASKQEKIVNLHTKDAEAEVLALLKKYQLQRAIIHWYSGPPDVLRQMIEFGLYFTVGVEVLHSEHIQNIAREIPLGQLLVETDNPGAMAWLVDKPGHPHDLLPVMQAVAELKGLSPAELTQIIADNFCWLVRDDLDRYPVMIELKRELAQQQQISNWPD